MVCLILLFLFSSVRVFYPTTELSSQSYITTGGQSASLSWCQASISSPWPDFRFVSEKLRVYWCGAPSLTRGWVRNLLVQLLLGLPRAVTLESKSRRIHDDILLSNLRLSQPGGLCPRIYILQEQDGPAIPSGTGFPFVSFYDSQGYGGGILTCLHMVQLNYQSQCYNYGRQSVGQSVLVSSTHLGPAANISFSFKFSLDSCGFITL
jgi:hypothetical protein